MRELLRFSNKMKRKQFFGQYGSSIRFPVECLLNETEENPKELYKQMSSMLNDLEDTQDSTKQVKTHRIMTECYFVSVRKIIQDFVPKRIKHRMLQTVLTAFENRMHQEVFVPYVIQRAFDKVLIEEESVKEDRLRTEEMLKAVDEALNIMVEIQII